MHCLILRNLWLNYGFVAKQWETLGSHNACTTLSCNFSIIFFPPGRGSSVSHFGSHTHSTNRSHREDDDGISGRRGTAKRRKVCLPLEALIPLQSIPLWNNVNPLTPSSPQAQDNQLDKQKEFRGDWTISAYNAQGLLASNVTRQQAKMRKARRLAITQDVLVLEESHGNEGKCKAARLPKGYVGFWCNGDDGEAGVCAWVKQEFIDKNFGAGGFDMFTVVAGRAAVLRGWGAEGRIQVGIVYLPTGNSGGRKERCDVMRKLMTEMGKWDQALNIVLGDFNYVSDSMDRISGDTPVFTGGADNGEAKEMEGLLAKLDLKELEQTEFTYRFQDCRSRLDRIYTNMKHFEWLDRDIGCVALGWNDYLSRHRPISAYRRSNAERGND